MASGVIDLGTLGEGTETAPAVTVDIPADANGLSYTFTGVFGGALETAVFPVAFRVPISSNVRFGVSASADYFNTGTFDPINVWYVSGYLNGQYKVGGISDSPYVVKTLDFEQDSTWSLGVRPKLVGLGENDARFHIKIDVSVTPDVGPSQLFTPQNDSIDFNSLSPEQKAAIDGGAVTNNALDGSDAVTLPNNADATAYYNVGDWFYASGGNDTINGGVYGDKVNGGSGADVLNGFGGNDWFFGGPDNDTINGGDGFDTSVLYGQGSDHVVFFVNPLLWKTTGPGGTDLHSMMENFSFDNVGVRGEQLFAQLVGGEQIASARSELIRLIKREGSLDQLINYCEQLINNAEEQITAANWESKLRLLNNTIDGFLKVFSALNDTVGKSVALSYKLGSILGTWGNEIYEERQLSWETYLKSIGGDIGKFFGGDAGGTAVSSALKAKKVVELRNNWKQAIEQIEDARERIDYYVSQQFDIENSIKAIETELRDKYAIGHGLPKVRLDGESSSTPNKTAQLATMPDAPDAYDMKLASYNSKTKTAASWTSLTLSADQINLTLKGIGGIDGTGNALGNKLIGNDSNNVLDGLVGNDTLSGLEGGDKLNGGSGNDILGGGAGKDIFTFSTALGTPRNDRKVNFDKVTDFSVEDDSLWLDNAIFKKLGSGTEARPKLMSKAFFAVDKAKDKNDYVIYNKNTGVLSYDADGSGKGQAVEFAQLKKGLALTYKDFFVI